MNSNLIRVEAINAFRYYKNNDKIYADAMRNMYSEGKSNPSVTQIILDNTIQDGIKQNQKLISSTLKTKGKTSGFSPVLPMVSFSRAIDKFKAEMGIAMGLIEKNMKSEKIPFDEYIQKFDEKQIFDTRMSELYPRTKELRERMIFDGHRVKIDKVTEKADWHVKIIYAKPLQEYRRLYPKSLTTRCRLLLEKQIRSGEVTQRVNGFMKRLSYKSFVNKSFSFLKAVK